MNRISKTALGAAALGLFLTTAASAPALAQAPAGVTDDPLLAAMAAELGTDAAGAQDVLHFQADATATIDGVAAVAGDAYAGSWLDENNRTVYVAATTEAALAAAADAGAVPVPATHSLDDLAAITARIGSGTVPAAITSWGVDVAANVVSVDVFAGGEQAATDYLAAVGVPADAVRFDTAPAALQPREDLRGGIAYYINNSSRCSIGFPVQQGGFVTAGHCGSAGDNTNYGTVEGSSFPENDYGWVSTGDRSLIGAVEDWNGGTVAVKGSTPAPVGATVCRSGSTTGWHCGQIEAYDTSVQYGSNTVNGLIQTNVCAEGGDSGGSLLAGDQAQGVTSGGWGDCTNGGQTWFQPVNEILDAYNLTLLTS